MDIRSLALKNILIDQKTNERYLDLTAPSFEYNAEFGIKAIHYVTQDQAGRIDLVANQYFGSGQNIDAICVLNNISNPFSVEEGDLLIIPNLTRNSDEVYFRPETVTRPDHVQAQYINADRQSKKDQSRIQRLAEKGKNKKSGVNSPLPPNVLQQGQRTKTLKNGTIELGTNLPTRK
tara:strand:+ start:1027 stop:1557 length:531 start_codon:yes stop_codon:yes gene_type:complete